MSTISMRECFEAGCIPSNAECRLPLGDRTDVDVWPQDDDGELIDPELHASTSIFGEDDDLGGVDSCEVHDEGTCPFCLLTT